MGKGREYSGGQAEEAASSPPTCPVYQFSEPQPSQERRDAKSGWHKPRPDSEAPLHFH